MPNVSPAAPEQTPTRGGRPIIAGFSARALAEAVTAWGDRPIVIDHFTDQDCRELAFSWYQIDNWGDPSDPLSPLTELLAELPAADSANWVLLGGGTENWPELLRELHRHFHVLGPSVEQLVKLRDYQFWRRAVVGSGICFPDSHPAAPLKAQIPDRQRFSGAAGVWLWKPIRGAGGVSIQPVCSGREGITSLPSPLAPAICQQKIDGRSLGAHCILTGDVASLLGITESWTAADWPAPREFIYRGSWGPLPVAENHSQQILKLCANIHSATGYVGWLQMDFIEDAAGQLWLLELNPRWAAGMEILLLAGINPVDYHVAAWQQEPGYLRSYARQSVGHNAEFLRSFARQSVGHNAEFLRSYARQSVGHNTEFLRSFARQSVGHNAEFLRSYAHQSVGHNAEFLRSYAHQSVGHNAPELGAAGEMAHGSSAGNAALPCRGLGSAVSTQYGKGIVYAERSLQLTADKLRRLHALARTNFVDLPAVDMAGEIITAGQPLLTVRTACASGTDEQITRENLLAQLLRLRDTALEVLEEETGTGPV